jgi:hypothetical protein
MAVGCGARDGKFNADNARRVRIDFETAAHFKRCRDRERRAMLDFVFMMIIE